MPGKQLLAVGCAVAILAFGACFGPGPRPAPPSLAPDLRASKRILVEVVNLSPTQHVPPRRLAAKIASALNERLNGADIPVVANVARRPGDAVLHVEILTESLNSESASASELVKKILRATYSVSFTAGNGASLWSASNLGSSTARYGSSDSDEKLWKMVLGELEVAIADNLEKQSLDPH